MDAEPCIEENVIAAMLASTSKKAFLQDRLEVPVLGPMNEERWRAVIGQTIFLIGFHTVKLQGVGVGGTDGDPGRVVEVMHQAEPLFVTVTNNTFHVPRRGSVNPQCIGAEHSAELSISSGVQLEPVMRSRVT